MKLSSSTLNLSRRFLNTIGQYSLNLKWLGIFSLKINYYNNYELRSFLFNNRNDYHYNFTFHLIITFFSQQKSLSQIKNCPFLPNM